MAKFNNINNIILARNSHRPEIMLSQSVMVELLSGLYYPNRGSIAQTSSFRLYSVGCLLVKNIRLFSSTSTKKNNNFFYSNVNVQKNISTSQKIMLFFMRTTAIMVGVVICKCLFLCWYNETCSWLDFFDNLNSLASVLVGIGSFAGISIGKLLELFTPLNITIRDLFVHSPYCKFILKKVLDLPKKVLELFTSSWNSISCKPKKVLDLFSSVWKSCKFNYKVAISLTGEGHLPSIPKGLSVKEVLTKGDSAPSSSGNQGGENPSPSGNQRGENPSASSSKKPTAYETEKAVSENKINFHKNRSSYTIDQAQKAIKLTYPQKEGESDKIYNKRIERAERVKYNSESRKYREVLPHRSSAEVIESQRKLSESMPKKVGESGI